MGEISKLIRCKLCGGELEVRECVTECMNCGASVYPETGEPFIVDGKVVKACTVY